MAAHVLSGLLLGLLIGMIVGALDESLVQAIIYGGVVGCLAGWLAQLHARVRRLESGEELDADDPWREDRVSRTTVTAAARTAEAVENAAPATSVHRSGRGTASMPTRDRPRAPVPSPAEQPPPERQQSGTSMVDQALAVARAWFTTGNVPVKLGVVVVLFGVAFFIRYAVDQQLLSFPVWVRLAAVALLGVIMLAIGWRLRHMRGVYALSLQGGGLGVLYLTTYAAFEFYALMPAAVAFAAMVVVTVATGVLALLQDSRALVVLGVTGGFLAPILAATDTGSHVLLFSYYAVLNAVILTIAWFKAWRPLNLLGFAFTFVIASLWGYQGYRPEHFVTTEPFLVLFVLMYIGVAVLFALRRPPNLRGFVDSTLVFGTPLVGFTLQTQLVENDAALAWTAGGLATLYALLGGALWRNKDLRLLAMSFGSLALLFLAVAFPLALDDRWTCAAWAVQAAALAWFGARNGSRLLLFAGVALHIVAVAAHVRAVFAAAETPVTPLLNGWFLAGTLLALTAWTVAWSFEHSRLSPGIRVVWTRIALGWATGWWYLTGVGEIVESVDEFVRSSLLGLAAVSAIAAMLVSHVVRWQRFNAVGLVLLPGLVVLLPFDLGVLTERHPLANLAWLAWPCAFAAQYAFLRYREAGYPTLAPLWHVGTYWVLAFLLASEAHYLAASVADGAWPLAAAVVAAAALSWATGPARARLPWPLDHHRRAYSGPGRRVVAGAAALVVLAANLTSEGGATPVPYLPLLNPLMIGAVVAGVAVWQSFGAEVWRRDVRIIAPVFVAVGLVLLSMEVARGVHHFAGVPFTVGALAGSAIMQAGLSLVWGSAGLAGMVVGAVRKRREVWIGGAAVMGIVIVKLFIVELGNVGTLSRVVSFLGVGLLLLVVGYFAPVPKGRGDEVAEPRVPAAPARR